MGYLKLFLILFIICLLLVPSGCSDSEDAEIPADVQAFLDAYLEAFQEGPEVSVDYVYFLPENASRYQYYRESIDWLVEYTIHDSVKVNDNLYAFLITYITNAMQEGYKEPDTCWTYVAKIDDEFRIVTSSQNIPNDLLENYDPDEFTVPEEYPTVSEEDIVDEEDIVGAVDIIEWESYDDSP